MSNCMLENWIDTWKAGYIERCTSGLEGSAWKPTAAMWQGAGCLAYVYTTEESEKLELQKLAKELGGNLELAVKRIAEMRRERKMSNGKA